jgi:hypothetical protein
MNRVALLSLIAACSTVWAEDGKKVVNRDGSCQVTVPASWEVGSIGGFANSADKKASVAVSSPRSATSFDSLKQTARGIYTKDKVTKDSASEFQMEGESISGKPNVYRGIPIAGGKFCIVEVIYQSGTIDDARRIAESVKSAK